MKSLRRKEPGLAHLGKKPRRTASMSPRLRREGGRNSDGPTFGRNRRMPATRRNHLPSLRDSDQIFHSTQRSAFGDVLG